MLFPSKMRRRHHHHHRHPRRHHSQNHGRPAVKRRSNRCRQKLKKVHILTFDIFEQRKQKEGLMAFFDPFSTL